eukprot:Skav228796  [mRNA]  locus=scaffold359:34364:34954:+ [translate_table: standard]
MKVFFFYDSKFVPLRDYMVASMESSGAGSAFQLQEDILDDLKGNNRAGGGMPTYLYKSAKIRKALDEVDKDEVFLFTDVDVQYFQPIDQILQKSMADGADIIFQKEFEDIGLECLTKTHAHRYTHTHFATLFVLCKKQQEYIYHSLLCDFLAR